MSTALTGNTISGTYAGLLKTSDNLTLNSALRTICDGLAVDSALQVSTASVKSTGTFAVTGASTFTGAVTLTGGLNTPLAVAQGGTASSTAAGARTALGLDTMATQAAGAVAITGGTVVGITDLAVADGGTGASTAAAAATNFGLGTGDSPQFTAINLGHASDTTIARVSAGVASIEGATIYTQGGALGTPASGVATNLTGTAAGLTAGVASAVAVGGITGLGTGVATALAVNVGSAGAPVVLGGAIGTPSSGTLTNCTGIAQASVTGLTTADSPQFAGLNVGHASDTTVTRASAGDINIEGNIAYRAGGTDVAVADGGTGSSTAAGARTNLGLGTMATQAASAVAITGGTVTGITDLAVADGGTGSSTAGGAATNLGLGTGDTVTHAGLSVGSYAGSATAVQKVGVPDSTVGIHMVQNGSGAFSFIECTTSGGTARFQANENGQVTCVSLVQTSSARFKTDIAVLGSNLDKAKRLIPRSYKFEGREEIGFVAEEMVDVVPEAVALDKEGKPFGINYSRLTAVLAGAIQEQDARIDSLEARLAKLEGGK